MVDTNNQDDTLLEFEEVEDTSLDGGFELEFEEVPEPVDMGFESVAPPEGVLPKPVPTCTKIWPSRRFGSLWLQKYFLKWKNILAPLLVKYEKRPLNDMLYEQSLTEFENWDGSLSWVDPETGEIVYRPLP